MKSVYMKINNIVIYTKISHINSWLLYMQKRYEIRKNIMEVLFYDSRNSMTDRFIY